MQFHPAFRVEKEQRLIFDGGAAAPAEGAAPVAEITEAQKKQANEVMGALKADPDAAAKIVEFKVEDADKDAQKFQEAFHSALEQSADAFYKSLTEGTEAEKVKKVNDVFQAAKSPVSFKFENGKLVAVAAEASKGKKEQPQLSPEDEQRLQDALTSFPKDIRKTAEQIMREILSDPKMREATVTFSRALGNLSPEARRYFDQNAATILSGEKLAEASPQLSKRANAFMNKVGLERAVATSQVRKEIEGFWKELGPDGQALAKKLVARTQSALAEESNNLSDEERADKLDGAKKWLLDKKFDASKASEIDKNLVLAQLQMRGIDTNNAEEIFTDPSKMKVFEGSPMERGFNQIMGLIGYVLLSIEKMKGMLKPGEKTDTGKGAEKTPEAQKAAEVVTGRESVRKMLKESQAQNLTKLIGEREKTKAETQKKIDGGNDNTNGLAKNLAAAKGRQAEAEQEVKTLEGGKDNWAKGEEKTKNEKELADKKKILTTVVSEVADLQQQLDREQATTTRLDAEIKAIKDVQQQTLAQVKAMRETCKACEIKLKPFVGKDWATDMLFEVLPDLVAVAQDELEIALSFGAGQKHTINEFLQAWDALGGDIAASGIDLETGTLKDPSVFMQQLESLVSKVTDQKAMLKERGFLIGPDGEIDFSRVTNKQLADEFETIEKLVPNGDLVRRFNQVLTDRIGSGLTTENEPLFRALVRTQIAALKETDAMDAARYFAQNNLSIRLDTDRIFVAAFTQDRAAEELQKAGLSEYIQNIFKRIKGGHSIRLF
ncbi:MAG: hypothetical protein PHN33_01590 [Candidatus Peribacteraceae bacterium]|nr:hypothetical protein [Candidatus Peribacteraceae bacterium]